MCGATVTSTAEAFAGVRLDCRGGHSTIRMGLSLEFTSGPDRHGVVFPGRMACEKEYRA
jgi:hypothetical protein